MSKDQILFEQIKRNENTAVERFYMQHREEFIHWLKRHYRSNHETAIEVYQQAFVICYENILNGSLNNLTSSLKTYLFAIGRNKMNEILRNESRGVPSYNDLLQVTETDSDRYDFSNVQKVNIFLQQLGNPCRDLLVAFYYHRKSLPEIALGMGYKNTDTVKNMKYKCLERLRKLFNSPGKASVNEFKSEN